MKDYQVFYVPPDSLSVLQAIIPADSLNSAVLSFTEIAGFTGVIKCIKELQFNPQIY